MKLPNGWETITFGDAFEYESKTGIKAGEGTEIGTYKFFTSSSEQTKHIGKFSFIGEHLIFATGGKAGVHYCNEKFSASNDCFVAKSKRKDIYTKYIYYFFRAHMHILELGFRGAGLKHIRSSYLDAVKIPKPPYETQKRIALLLEKTEKLKGCRADADRLTDELLKSVFYEMFGDPVNNPKNWKIEQLKSHIIDVRNGLTRRRKTPENSGQIVLRLKDIRDNTIIFDTPNRIMLDEKEKEKYEAVANDILFIRVNGNKNYVGRCAVFSGYNESVYFNDHIMRVKIDTDKYNPYFLTFVINSNYGKNQLNKYLMTSAGQYTINQTGLESLSFYKPSILLQNKFANIIDSVDRLKKSQANSKQAIDNLFNVLMQKGFKGELL